MRDFCILGVHHLASIISTLATGFMGSPMVGLVVLALGFAVQGRRGLSLLVTLIDGVHTIIISYFLIMEKRRDGQGRPILL